MSYPFDSIDYLTVEAYKELQVLAHKYEIFEHTEHAEQFTKDAAQVMKAHKQDVIRIMRND